MTTVAVVTIPAEEMVLAETLEQCSECYFRVEETAFTDADDFVHVWITSDDDTDVEEALAADPSVQDYSLVTDADEDQLYRLELDQQMLLPREVIHSLEGQILEAYACDGEWTLEVRFPDREGISKTAEQFDRFDIDATYDSITDLDLDGEGLPSSLTDRQREVLETAIEEGYYDVPRQVPLEELAEHLDVSHQALSECLRRAQKQLAENQISPDADQSSANVAR